MVSEPENIIVSEEFVNQRLDKFLATRFPDQSRSYFQYLIEHSLVLINGMPCKKRHPLKIGDEIEVEFALTPEISLLPENIPLEIIYEDEDILAINKPAGMVVHPAIGNWSGTFVNALLFYCRELDPQHSLRPGIVHRLDKDTTGVLIAAKNESTQQALVQLFASRQIYKQYLAICIGNPGKRVIEGAIGRHPSQRKKMAIVHEGKPAISECEPLKWNNRFSLVKLVPHTGRTHQLRVHLQSVGTPILGDEMYGNGSVNKKYEFHRQLLHAMEIRFKHPRTQKLIQIIANLPLDMQNFIAKEFA